MKHAFSTFILLLCSVINTPVQSQIWTQLLDFPGSARDDAAGFLIGNTFYVGTGLDGGFNAQRDFYKMDLQNETWSTSTSLDPGQERQYTTAFSHSTYGYLFGGIGPGLNYFQDLLRFDSNTSSWQTLSPIPAAGRRGAAAFVISNDAYIMGGNNPTQASSREVWKYNITNDSWQQMNDFPFTGLWRASACSVNGVGYVFGGIDSSGTYSNKLYRYDPTNDQWNLLATFSGNGRAYTQLVSMGNNIMFFGGYENGNIYRDDLWLYDLTNNQFVSYNPIPSLARRGYVSCVWNNTLYISTGLVATPARTAETWKVNGIVGLENLVPETIEVYPNPFTKFIQVNKNGHLEIFDAQGRKVYEKKVEKGNVYLDFLEVGFYYLKFHSSRNEFYSTKIYRLD